MNRSSDRGRGRTAAGIVAALLGAAASIAGAEDAADEPTPEQVVARAHEVDRSVREAERALVRSLASAGRRDDTARRAGDAGESIARLLAAVRDDSRRAADAMQWIIDNAPQ